MVSIGSKALVSRRSRSCNSGEDSIMEDKSYKHGGRKKGMSRKAGKEGFGFDGDNSKHKTSGKLNEKNIGSKNTLKGQNSSEPLPSIIRKQVDPETAKYFSEIMNLLESGSVELEERSVVCDNALEEAKGKEFELATDYITSHNLQTLLEGCSLNHLCGFLQGCAKVFPSIAMDRSGSHVAETALKSLVTHLQDNEAYSAIEETLTVICKVIVANPVDMMCNCYGSHVLRSLLCLCGGVPLDSPEFHRAKPAMILAERLNLKSTSTGGNDSRHLQQGFPSLLSFLVSEILRSSRKVIKTLLVDQYSSLVLQIALKMFRGNEQELLQVIPILLGSRTEDLVEGNFIQVKSVNKFVELMKETAYSHLMEVIIAVSPESLYQEMFTKIFRKSLYELSSHHCGNFVVQALISHARNKEQMESIWEELGQNFKDLLEMGRAGVIASLIAASQRLHTHERECCEALAAAVSFAGEPPRCIVPRILFLDNYFGCEDRPNWNWPNGVKMHTMGSLILQAVLSFRSEIIQPFSTSIASMEADRIFETAKDPGGARVIEAFLVSQASGKLKQRVIMKLRGKFGELALYSAGSFIVEKCFSASNLSNREAIASDVLDVQAELSKTKQGPFLLRRLDIDGFANGPDHWRSKQASKQSTYMAFNATFGSSEGKSSSRSNSFLANSSKNTSAPQGLKQIRKEIDQAMEGDMVEVRNKKLKSNKGQSGSDIGSPSKKTSVPFLSFLSGETKGKKRQSKDRPTKHSKKKLKV